MIVKHLDRDDRGGAAGTRALAEVTGVLFNACGACLSTPAAMP